ncbi:MAG: aminotransferase class I/II-fold pyridoxal phosphate-dependent enzyme [Gemmatimonadetes bacterium]|nr:aminotransferase class I/II-fold pyridoxal phosphate-dependent enzyme [Gemmatimonadota bacterium]
MLSAHFRHRAPSAIRVAGIRFAERGDRTDAINVAIGNVSLPMHPAMVRRLGALRDPGSPFSDGVVRYTATVGTDEARAAFLHVLEASGAARTGLHCQITDGGSQAMELVIVGLCGAAGSGERPLMLLDAAYTNYLAFAERTGRATVSVQRTLGDDGEFSLPDFAEMEAVMKRERPGALVVIPYDNPTGQFLEQESLVELARLCVRHDVALVSDEAYRELFYTGRDAASVWKITEADVPGITGRRISLETASKVWNACGLRIGALITDSAEFHRAAVAENTASLCSNAIGQYIFAALGEETPESLHEWFAAQRTYYHTMMKDFTDRTRELIPGAIVSRPDASLYSVVDVRNLVDADFDALEFVLWCAAEGRVARDGRDYTLLTAPMAEFYDIPESAPNPGRTQLRVAYVETPERMRLVPELLSELFRAYVGSRATP